MALTFIELVNEVLVDIGRTPDAVDNVAVNHADVRRAKSYINRAIRTVMNYSDDWSWMDATATIDVVLGTRDYAIPETINEDTIHPIVGSFNNHPLCHLPFDEFLQRRYDFLTPTQDNIIFGFAEFYTIRNGQLMLLWDPPVNETLTIYARSKHTQLMQNSDTSVVPDDHLLLLVIPYALFLYKRYLGDADANTHFVEYQENMITLLARNRNYGDMQIGKRPENL